MIENFTNRLTRSHDNIEFHTLTAERLRLHFERCAQGLFVARNPWNFSNRRAITEFATDRRLPAIYPTREFAEVAGLISYGPSLSDLYRRAAGHVDKILKGAKAAELPVEQPTKFDLVINSKTAKVLGVNIPSTLLALADEVIE